MGFVLYDLIKGGTPDYAGEAQKAEEKRQAQIKKGKGQIDRAFAGFNEDFYKKRQQAYMDFALPQLADQYRATRNQLGFGLANRGLRGSGAAQKEWGDLFRTNVAAKQGVVDSAIGQSNDLRKSIAESRQNLINQLYQTADPASASQAAVTTAAGFQAPSTIAPLANQFSGLINQFYVSQLLNQRVQQPTTPPGYGTGSDSGSLFAPIPKS